jgi:hypothetical protein
MNVLSQTKSTFGIPEIHTAPEHLGRRARLPLSTVPRVAFSEAMRDVDLIVAVASIGTDQHWQEWEQRRLARQFDWAQLRRDYEQLATASAIARADLLRELLPNLGLGDRARLDGHFVLVDGNLGRYRIHLGSGNIHMEPSGRYLCIVPGPLSTQKLYLPFEGDDTKTAEILSKILLLLEDDRIRDESILRQIRLGS